MLEAASAAGSGLDSKSRAQVEVMAVQLADIEERLSALAASWRVAAPSR